MGTPWKVGEVIEDGDRGTCPLLATPNGIAGLNKMLPVCYKDADTVFYSACHAGILKIFQNDKISKFTEKSKT